MFSERLSQYLAPATIVTVIIGALYLIGWFFSLSYYDRLNIHSYFFEFSPLYYLKIAFLPIYIAGFILAISLLGKFNYTIISAFRRNLIFLLAGILMIVLGIRLENIRIFIIFGSIILLIISILSIKKLSLVDNFFNKNITNTIALLIFIFIITMLLSVFLGDLKAQNQIESEIVITFHWKDDPPMEIEGKDLVLIDERGGNYYVVERKKTVNGNLEVYLIPKDQIKFATLKNLGNN